MAAINSATRQAAMCPSTIRQYGRILGVMKIVISMDGLSGHTCTRSSSKCLSVVKEIIDHFCMFGRGAVKDLDHIYLLTFIV